MPEKTFLEIVASCTPQRKTRKAVKKRMAEEQIKRLGKELQDVDLTEKDVYVVLKDPIKAVNIKLHPDEFKDLEQLSSLAAGGNTSELIRRFIFLLKKDLAQLQKSPQGKALLKQIEEAEIEV